MCGSGPIFCTSCPASPRKWLRRERRVIGPTSEVVEVGKRHVIVVSQDAFAKAYAEDRLEKERMSPG